ncbi:MAG: ferritin-like domain-containing protein [Dehalococcoidia bacterium]
MFEADSITEEGKRAIVDLINKSVLQVEYSFIVNYPRIIDHFTNVYRVFVESFRPNLEKLGKDSLRHQNLAMEIIRQLGGKPTWSIDDIDRMNDVRRMLSDQLEREKTALSAYLEARDIAKQAQVKGLKGMMLIIRSVRHRRGDNEASRSNMISMFEKLARDEVGHIRLLEGIMSELRI